jgi:hypothetical protein
MVFNIAPVPETSQVLVKAMNDATSLKDFVGQNKNLTFERLEEAFSNIKGAVMICFPMGLPKYDPVQTILDDAEDLTGTAVRIREIFK